MYDYIYVNINIFDLMKLNWPVLIRRFDLGVARDHSRTRNKFENVNFVFFGQLKGQRQKNNMKLTSSSMSSIWLTLAIPSSTEVSFSPIICFFFSFWSSEELSNDISGLLSKPGDPKKLFLSKGIRLTKKLGVLK